VATLIGSVDLGHRLIVRLKFATGEDEWPALIDTGFNGALLMPAAIARALHTPMSETRIDLEFGDGVLRPARRTRVNLTWLGRDIEVDTFVIADTERRPTSKSPEILIGTRLLAPHLLLIDFTAGTIEIEAQ
jgi:predicted aspartyl protease